MAYVAASQQERKVFPGFSHGMVLENRRRIQSVSVPRELRGLFGLFNSSTTHCSVRTQGFDMTSVSLSCYLLHIHHLITLLETVTLTGSWIYKKTVVVIGHRNRYFLPFTRDMRPGSERFAASILCQPVSVPQAAS